MEDVPLPAEGYGAPLPLDACRQAPPTEEDAAAVERLMDTTEWMENREYWLRQAALSDRRALASTVDSLLQGEAQSDAWLLREWDDAHGTSAGKHPAFADEWHSAGGSRTRTSARSTWPGSSTASRDPARTMTA
ncbi:hypothetical protein AB0G55_20980 [Streptomyces toyocaensis]|uniref:hypothetical protein n=1 Tax=Streptomyces toyocaensis TaxID=55952 RepID=UPI000691BA68|nr:hypothetical protein [Streptomyces toyocaensis]